MRRARVDALGRAGEQLPLSPATSHHLLRVLRLGVGATVELFDGDGACATATLVAVEDGVATVQQLDDPLAQASRPPLHLLIGVPKKPAFDLIVRMATELGVSHIHPLALSRSVPTGVRVDRMERITEAAAHQSHRNALPTLYELSSLDEAIARLPDDLDRRVALPSAPGLPPANAGAALLVGPEGGLTQAEVDRALRADFAPMGLGPLVLRADTACAAAIARVAPW